jgi:hypothetical protein
VENAVRAEQRRANRKGKRGAKGKLAKLPGDASTRRSGTGLSVAPVRWRRGSSLPIGIGREWRMVTVDPPVEQVKGERIEA